MDQTAFAHLARLAAALRTRRALAIGLAALPFAGSALPVDDAAAKPKPRRNAERRHARTHAEKKHKQKKATYCVNGQTTQVSVSKKSKKKLKNQGATPGACAVAPPPAACSTCPSSQRCCGAACVTGVWANQTTFGSGPGAGSSNLDVPTGVALVPDGLTALVTDSNNNRVSVWTRPSATGNDWGIQKTFGTFGTGSGFMRFPAGIAVTQDGLTAVFTDYYNHRVDVWKRTSVTSDDWSAAVDFGAYGSVIGRFDSPNAVSLTADGRTAVVADSGNNRVAVWTRSSATTTDWNYQHTFGSGPGSAASELRGPCGVAVTADGLLVAVADTFNSRVSIWTRGNTTADFAHQTTFGSGPGAAPNQFNLLRGIALSPDALTAYISEQSNNRVSVWTRPTAGSTAWAPLTTVGSGPGSGAANFNTPQGVALTPDGQTLLVTDTSNNRVSVWAMTCPA